MPFNLFALCEVRENYIVKHIPLNADTQVVVSNMFEAQKNVFITNKEETPFSGDWKPEDDEILTITAPEDAEVIISTYQNIERLMFIPILNLSEFDETPIKALFGSNDNGQTILVQRFTQNQFLARKLSLFMDNHTYNKLETPTISFDNKLLCVISSGTIKFNNFSNMRCVFNMKEYYKTATDEDISAFSAHPSINIPNVENLKETANQNIRKRIHNLLRSNVLNDFSANDIYQKAQEHGFNNLITIQNNKILFPDNAKEILKVLCFLDEKLYKGVFSELIIMANSTKAAD